VCLSLPCPLVTLSPADLRPPTFYFHVTTFSSFPVFIRTAISVESGSFCPLPSNYPRILFPPKLPPLFSATPLSRTRSCQPPSTLLTFPLVPPFSGEILAPHLSTNIDGATGSCSAESLHMLTLTFRPFFPIFSTVVVPPF